MTPVIPSAASSIALFPGTVFRTDKNVFITRSKISGEFRRRTQSSLKFVSPLPASVRLFPQHRRKGELFLNSRMRIISATGTDVAVDEAETPSITADSSSKSTPVAGGESSTKPNGPAPVQPRRTRPGRKSEMPPIADEELIPGATFTGKVRSIQPFGAFVDFGAFTDGLVHVSQLSDSYIKDVASFVSIGQEVKVRLVEANSETGRISLTMRETDGSNKSQQQKDGPPNADKSRPPRKNNAPRSNQRKEKTTKFVKGQDLVGTVKNLARSGAFITLPEDEEGFLPQSEEVSDGFENIMGGTSLQIGQEVNVRVLRIARGQVTLTMKKEEDLAELDSQLSQRVVHVATNPFVVAFRKNKDISQYLDEKEKQKETETVKEIQSRSEPTAPSAAVDILDENKASDEAESNQTDNTISESSETLDGALQTAKEEVQAPSEDVADKLPTLDPEPSPVEDSIQSDAKEVAVDVDNDVQTEATALEIEQLPGSTAESIGVLPEETSGIGSSHDDVPVPTSEENAVNVEASEREGLVLTADDESDLSVVEVKEAPVTIENAAAVESSEQGKVPLQEETLAKAAISPAIVKQLREETGAGMMDCKKALSETGGDISKAQEFLRMKGLASADKKASRATAEGRIGSYIHDSRIGVLIEVNCETDFVSRGDIFRELVDDLAMQVAACPQVQYLSVEDVPEEFVKKETELEMQKEDLMSKPEQFRSKIVEGRIRKRLEELALLEQPFIKNDKMILKDLVKQTIATIGENIKVRRFVRYNLGEGLEKKNQDFAAEVAAQTATKAVSAPVQEKPATEEAKEAVEKKPVVAVSAALVKQLREETGAGMMDCKKALSETEGDLQKAQEYLRKKGLSAADKKSSRLAAEGRIGTYIHDTRIGVLIEVNCETDFVGRSEKFKELVDDLAMQVVACPQVQYVSIEDIPAAIVSKEKALEMQREDLLSKPENIREKIVEGRIAKRLGEVALLEQPFIKNDSLLVKDLVKQTVAALGENIKVRRFVRFTLGEKLENISN
uniref:Elongation factor Ts, mitochondrial n=1 Tax=Kalanchoe fedtschenkoi TaxID=63787 RepID=A0A7N0TET2_KALFE